MEFLIYYKIFTHPPPPPKKKKKKKNKKKEKKKAYFMPADMVEVICLWPSNHLPTHPGSPILLGHNSLFAGL
jgi:hypothetical protein